MLSQKNLQDCREKLILLRERLSDQLAHLRAEAAHSNGDGEVERSVHRDDLGKEKANEEVLLGMAENESQLRQEVEDALARMGDGLFGICETCQKSIPKNRLEAIPYARYCVDCAR